MSNKEHRLGVSEVNLVVRHLKLEKMTDSIQQELMAAIDETYGIDSVTFEEKPGVLNIAYDATRIDIDGIEELIHQHGAEVSHDWWTRFKEGYYRFVDENVKDNANHEPWNCHQPQAKHHPYKKR